MTLPKLLATSLRSAIYRKADRAAVFAGWRDMNDYMRENKIEPVAPQLAVGPATRVAGTKAAEADEPKATPATDKAAPKSASKSKSGKAHDS